ncbi:MAG TPA: response regulator [Ramlibacter sp.]|nr:response regulator [Ramlibacter sp.]
MTARKRILIIDDDAAVVALLVQKLARSAFDVLSTVDPHKALGLAKSEQPDVVLCDIDMPGMNGGDVAAALAADPETAHIPLIYLTSLVSPNEARDLGGQVGGRPGVSKRAPLAELVACINAARPGAPGGH